MQVVAHNLEAMNVERNLQTNAKTKSKSSEKLASGYRINRAADDAAGLSISEKMRYQRIKQGNFQYFRGNIPDSDG